MQHPSFTAKALLFLTLDRQAPFEATHTTVRVISRKRRWSMLNDSMTDRLEQPTRRKLGVSPNGIRGRPRDACLVDGRNLDACGSSIATCEVIDDVW